MGASTGDQSYTLPRRDVKRVTTRVQAAPARANQGIIEDAAQSVSNLMLSGLEEHSGVGQH